MPQKRILLLSVSAGAGHVRAAEAIRAYAEHRTDEIAATHLEVMAYVPAGFRKVYTDFYIKLVNKAPSLWGYLYRITNEAKPDSSMTMKKPSAIAPSAVRTGASRGRWSRLWCAVSLDSFRSMNG